LRRTGPRIRAGAGVLGLAALPAGHFRALQRTSGKRAGAGNAAHAHGALPDARRPARQPPGARTALDPASTDDRRVSKRMPSRRRQPSPAAGGQGDYLWEVLGTLWPSPESVTRSSRPGPGRRGRPDGPGSTEFLVFPDERRAALLVPRQPRRVAAAALRNYKASSTPRDPPRLHPAALLAPGAPAAAPPPPP